MTHVPSLIVFCASVFLVALFGSQFQPDAWYRSLDLPAWQPPGWVFAPVWTVLYLFIALSGWMVWKERGRKARIALGFWGVQLLINGLWSWIFFGLHRPGLALADIVLLLITLALTLVMFWRISRPATLLLVPYFLWVAYAATLNLAIWRMNP
ncbi:MAG: TspO/MBR family protein [Desulfovibrionales bacterium]